MKHEVQVYGKIYEVSVYQKSKSVWEAVGHFKEVLVEPEKISEVVRVTGSSENAALAHWVKTAKYIGN